MPKTLISSEFNAKNTGFERERERERERCIP